MKILDVMLGRGLGGIEQCFVDYAEMCQLQGHEVHALCHPHAAILPKMNALPGIHLHPEGQNFGAWDPIAKFRLKRLLKRIQPDVILIHGNRAVALLADAARTLRIPTLGTTHNNFFTPLLRLDHILTITPTLREKVLAKGFAENRIHPFPNTIRLPQPLPKAQPLNTAAPRIGCIARLMPQKGIDVLLYAFAEVIKEYPTATLHLAGEGILKTELQTQAQSLDIAHAVTFHGWVEDTQAFLQSLDVFCLPSRWEAFGIVLLEAMASNRPIVTTNTDGAKAILNAENALIVPPENASALADALLATLNHPADATARAACAQHDVQRYALPNMAKELDAILRHVTA